MGDHKGIDNSIDAWNKRMKADPLIEIEVGPGRKKLIRQSQLDKKRGPADRVGPAMHDVMDAHNDRARKWYKYKHPPPVIEDYRHPDAAKTWPGYQRVHTEEHGWVEGPRPFANKREEALYERTYGFHQETGQKWDRARQQRRG